MSPKPFPKIDFAELEIKMLTAAGQKEVLKMLEEHPVDPKTAMKWAGAITGGKAVFVRPEHVNCVSSPEQNRNWLREALGDWFP